MLSEPYVIQRLLTTNQAPNFQIQLLVLLTSLNALLAYSLVFVVKMGRVAWWLLLIT
jgi:hypothetical protein